MESISRRKLLTSSVAVAASALVPRCVAVSSARARAVYPTDPSAYLEVVPLSQAEGTVSKLFPGLLERQDFAMYIPSSFVVTNKSKFSLMAFSVDWQLFTNSDVLRWSNLLCFRPHARKRHSVHWGISGDATRYTGNMPVIAAGQQRLISPFFNWSPSYYSKNSSKIPWKHLPQRCSTYGVDPQEIASKGYLVRMNVDSLITTTMRSVGPNLIAIAQKVKNMRNAEHDEAVVVLGLVVSGEPASSVRSTLVSHATGSAFAQLIQPETKDYYSSRKRAAATLLRRLDKVGLGPFTQTLQYLQSRPKTKLRRA